MNDLIFCIALKAMLKAVKFDDETEFIEWYNTASPEEKEKLFEEKYNKNDRSQQDEIDIEKARSLYLIVLEWYYRKAIALTKKEKKQLDKVYSKKMVSIYCE